MQIGDRVKITKVTIQELTRLNIPREDIDKILDGISGKVTKVDTCTATVKFKGLEGGKSYQLFKKYIEVV